jgi:hypothetical protein
MVKLYKYFKSQSKEGEAHTSVTESGGIVSPAQESTKSPNQPEKDKVQLSELAAESHVGAAMSDLTTRRVIVLVLVMLIAIPLMSYSTSDFAPSFGTKLVHRMAKENVTYPGVYNVGSIQRIHLLTIHSVLLFAGRIIAGHRQRPP